MRYTVSALWELMKSGRAEAKASTSKARQGGSRARDIKQDTGCKGKNHLFLSQYVLKYVRESLCLSLSSASPQGVLKVLFDVVLSMVVACKQACGGQLN